MLLIPVILALVATAVYHISVNGELQFEQRGTDEHYINTERSYRPQIPAAKATEGKETDTQ